MGEKDMLRQVERIELIGTPEPAINPTLHFQDAEVPGELEAAARNAVAVCPVAALGAP